MMAEQEMLTVEQVDREAAADVVGFHGRAIGVDSEMRGGNRDEHPLVQAFARHRLAAADERVRVLTEALRPFVDGASHTMVFLRTNEKMHSCGRNLYHEDVERARAALAEAGGRGG